MEDNGFVEMAYFLIKESLPDCPESSFDGTRYHTNLRWHEKLKWKAKWAGWLAEFDLSLAQLSPSLFFNIIYTVVSNNLMFYSLFTILYFEF